MSLPPLPASLPASLQALPPSSARFCLALARFVEQELAVPFAGGRILVAFSGGADSTALLLALHCLAPSRRLTLAAAHLDHALRPSSAAETDWCGKFCDRLGIPYTAMRSEHVVAFGTRGIEERARNARYAFLNTSAASLSSDWIATGHTGNDLAEDILMRLIRGAGWPGLAGMTGLDRQRKLLRPLLMTSRLAVESFLNDLGVPWLTDESNEDERYLRNRIRSGILPQIMKENPAFLETAAGLWRLGRFDEAYFDSLLADLPATDINGGNHSADASAAPEKAVSLFLAHEQLLLLPKALRLRLYKRVLDRLGPGQARLDGLLALDASWQRAGEPTEHAFPGGKRARVTRKGIAWARMRS